MVQYYRLELLRPVFLKRVLTPVKLMREIGDSSIRTSLGLPNSFTKYKNLLPNTFTEQSRSWNLQPLVWRKLPLLTPRDAQGSTSTSILSKLSLINIIFHILIRWILILPRYLRLGLPVFLLPSELLTAFLLPLFDPFKSTSYPVHLILPDWIIIRLLIGELRSRSV